MYRLIVRRRTAQVFQRLSRGEWQRLVESLPEHVHHVFPGAHSLGGERRTRESVRLWFERLVYLFPGHSFEVHHVTSCGWPWDIWVAVQWTAQMRPRAGEPYVNDGVHWIHLRWGKVSGFHAYLDTQRVAEACAEMARLGVSEAAAAPIID